MPKPRTQLLVAHCTTSRQSKLNPEPKKHCFAQCVGCGCAKQLFPTTTNTKTPNKPYNNTLKNATEESS